MSSEDEGRVLPASSIQNQSDTSSEMSHDLLVNNSMDIAVAAANASLNPILDTYAKTLCVFSFDEAKTFAEKQASRKSMDPLWGFLLQVSASVAQAEKQYLNLSFLAPRGFLRKESNLKSSLEHLKHDLHKFSETDLAPYASELLFFLSLRLDQMDFYEKLSLLGSAKYVEIEDLISEYEIISEKYAERKKAVSGITLGFPQILTSLGWEVETLLFLLKTHSAMQRWDFFSSVIASQDSQKRLSEWTDFLQSTQSSKKSTFLNSGSGNPCLYSWLVKLRVTLLSKFSLYFYDILAQYSTNPAVDMKLVFSKLHTDYYSKVTSFVKKSDALSVCLIFDSRDTVFNPNGYSFPARPQETPTGVSTFPAILAIPCKPVTHWPSVVMLINDHLAELDSDKLVGFYDNQVHTTYFLAKIDLRMYMLAVFESKKSEKDSYVGKFLSEMAVDLKCGKIFASLKTIAK